VFETSHALAHVTGCQVHAAAVGTEIRHAHVDLAFVDRCIGETTTFRTQFLECSSSVLRTTTA